MELPPPRIGLPQKIRASCRKAQCHWSVDMKILTRCSNRAHRAAIAKSAAH